MVYSNVHIFIIRGIFMEKTQTIGMIGTGVMGKSMAQHMLDHGYDVAIFTRTKEKAKPLIKNVAIWKDKVADVAKVADIIITTIGTQKDVKEVYLTNDGI